MTSLQKMAAAALPAALVLGLCGFVTTPPQTLKVPVIVTAAPVYEPLAALRGEERFPKGARLLLFENGKAAPLTPEFAATADAAVSFDGACVLFAGKKSAAEPWSIWQTCLATHEVKQIIAGATNLIRPFYLPGHKLLYARHTAHGYQLETANEDGTDALALTYIAASAIADDVLADGRILFEAGFPLGAPLDQGAIPEQFLVYSDGSGVESYRCDHEALKSTGRWGGKQLSSGDVVFTRGSALGRFTSPLATEARVTAPTAQYAGGVLELPSGEWLVSARSGAARHFALNTWTPGAATLRALASHADEDLVEPVLVAARHRPNHHPSALHDWDYANLLALDARTSREGALRGTPVQVRLEVQDESGNTRVLGTAPVEADGSFFLKAPGDKPIRFALLDDKGAVLREEQGWFWIRKGEQRICVGCHAGPERAAENRVPQVLFRTTIPVDLAGAGLEAVSGGR